MSPSSATQPRYHPVHAAPYQINYRAKRSGKHITVTKRRVAFQFGFADPSPVAAGLSENECRGEEHEVILIWSHVSGKRQLFLDGMEIHASKAARGNTKFTYSWSAWGTHTLKIIAHGSPNNNDGGRQFDLQLDGRSYFDFCHIYQLGGSNSCGGKKSEAIVPTRAPSIETLPTQISCSSNEYRGDDDRRPVVDLQIDVLDAPIDSCDLLGCELPSPYSECDYQGTVATALSSYDEFSPVHFDSSYGGNQKSFAAVSDEILTAYGAESYGAPAPARDPTDYALASMPAAQDPAMMDPLANSTPEVSINNHALVPANNAQQGAYTSYSTDPPSASTENRKQIVSMYDNVQERDSSVDDLTACMNKLVNLDDVSKPAESRATSNTTNPLDKNQSLQWALSNGGRAPTLSEIHSMKSRSGRGVQVMGNPHLYQGASQQQYCAASYSYGNAY